MCPVASFDLKGRAALVTGAASGLGFALSLALASAGARVALLDLSKPVATAPELAGFGPAPLILEGSVTDEEFVRQAAGEVEKAFGRLDILVNCAGVVQQGNVATEELSLSEWERVMGVNLTGTFLCCKHFGGLMIKGGGGSIINVSSTAGTRGIPRQGAYAASKAGVNLFTKSLAVEWAKHGVRVNAVAPHYLETPLTQAVREHDGISAALTAQIPLKRFGRPDEVSGAVLLLASDAGSYITGSLVEVNGGFLA